MIERLPSVTIVIAARPGQQQLPAVDAARRLDYPQERLEIIVARGKQPSAQRNAAIQAAQGEVIYFLDDDSVPQPGHLQRVVACFKDPQVKMVGGPNLCPPDAPFLEQVFAVVLSSWLAFGPSRARYDASGALRESSEKELILCNLLARRESLLELGGFDESLYPNEENALMDELQRRGGKLLYDPRCIVYRHPRSTLPAFARMLLTYGRGRAEQFRLHPTLGSALNFVPPLFCLYLLLLPFLLYCCSWKWPVLNMHLTDAVHGRVIARSDCTVGPQVGMIPLLVYASAVVIQTVCSAVRKGFFKSLVALPLVVLTWLLYGLGFWRGLFTKLRPAGQHPSGEVTLENVSL